MKRKLSQYQSDAGITVFPSHGRGRRFNPYSAHHFYWAFRHKSAQPCQNKERPSVDSALTAVPSMFTEGRHG